MNSSFKCICNGAVSKNETCSSWSDKCAVNGYPDETRCKFWAQIYTFQR